MGDSQFRFLLVRACIHMLILAFVYYRWNGLKSRYCGRTQPKSYDTRGCWRASAQSDLCLKGLDHIGFLHMPAAPHTAKWFPLWTKGTCFPGFYLLILYVPIITSKAKSNSLYSILYLKNGLYNLKLICRYWLRTKTHSW